MIKLKPIRTQRKEEILVEKKIARFFEEILFDPIKAALIEENQQLNNSKSEIIKRLKSNKIEFYDGKFKGQFNARISNTFEKLGATFNKREKAFVFKNAAEIPFDIQTAIVSQQSNASALNEKALGAINTIENNIKQLDLNGDFQQIIKTVDNKFKANNKLININFNDLLPEAKAKIAAEWSDNLNLFIKNFLDKEIISLRTFVQQNAVQGFRASNLEAELQKQFNISRNKARFLARQETSLFTANYTKQRYQIAGINEYIWSTSQGEKVRDDHRRLNGKKFSFDDPPITNLNTGARNNPGEDFNCECVPIPVI